MKKVKAAVIVMALLCTACGSHSGTSSQPVNDILSPMEKRGDTQKLDQSDSLAGPDKDANGIRDDIDAYIASLTLDSAKKFALNHAARSLQFIQETNTADPDESREAMDRLMLSIVCLAIPFPGHMESTRHLKKLEIYTTNTPKRARQYKDFGSAMDGSYTRLPSESNCE